MIRRDLFRNCYNTFSLHLSSTNWHWLKPAVSILHWQHRQVFYSTYLSLMDSAKKNAAYKAINEYVTKETKIIGIGSGSTIVFAVECLAEKVQKEQLDVICIPTSFQAKQLIFQNDLALGDLEKYPELDVAFDGADEADSEMTLIKGGGGCLTQEKIVASCSKQLIIVADHTKNSNLLGENYLKGIPIEVIPMAWTPVKNKIEKKLGGQAILRMALRKAGPVVTDNNNFIIDWKFIPGKHNWAEIDNFIKMIPGVVETGLFVKMANKIFYGMEDGSVKIK